ncbi:MAG: hypothetical protein MK193_13575 [Lentisphaeria bacterium]|nr:hypothetical protein [Lentisphaeria bacterium]
MQLIKLAFIIQILALFTVFAQIELPDEQENIRELHWLEINTFIQTARDSVNKDELKRAYGNYQLAAERIQQLQNTSPGFFPNVLKYQLKECRIFLKRYKDEFEELDEVYIEELWEAPLRKENQELKAALIRAIKDLENVNVLNDRIEELLIKNKKLLDRNTDLSIALHKKMPLTKDEVLNVEITKLSALNVKLQKESAQQVEKLKSKTVKLQQDLEKKVLEVTELSEDKFSLLHQQREFDVKQQRYEVETKILGEKMDEVYKQLAVQLAYVERLKAHIAELNNDNKALASLLEAAKAGNTAKVKDDLGVIAETVVILRQTNEIYQESLAQSSANEELLKLELDSLQIANSKLRKELAEVDHGAMKTLAEESDHYLKNEIMTNSVLTLENQDLQDTIAAYKEILRREEVASQLKSSGNVTFQKQLQELSKQNSRLKAEKLQIEIELSATQRLKEDNQTRRFQEQARKDKQRQQQQASARKFFEEKQYDRSNKLYKSLFEEQPSALMALFIAKNYMLLKDFSQSSNYYAAAAKLQDGPLKAAEYEQWLESLVAQNATLKLVEISAQALNHYPQNPLFINKLGEGFLLMGWYSAAEQQFYESWKIDKKSLDTATLLAKLYISWSPQYKTLAQKWYQKALSLGLPPQVTIQSLKVKQ